MVRLTWRSCTLGSLRNTAIGAASGQSSSTGLKPIPLRGFGREGERLTHYGENYRRGLCNVSCGGPLDRLAISFGGKWQPGYLHGSGCTKLCRDSSLLTASGHLEKLRFLTARIG